MKYSKRLLALIISCSFQPSVQALDVFGIDWDSYFESVEKQITDFTEGMKKAMPTITSFSGGLRYQDYEGENASGERYYKIVFSYPKNHIISAKISRSKETISVETKYEAEHSKRSKSSASHKEVKQHASMELSLPADLNYDKVKETSTVKSDNETILTIIIPFMVAQKQKPVSSSRIIKVID